MRSKKNNLIILGLCSILLLMGIGYAAFSSKLNITGTSNITSTWDVRITNIESELHGAEDIEEPSYDNTNGLYASFNTGLKRPGDYALYTVTIENRGSVDARIEKINTYYKENKYITFTLSGLTKGDVIKGKETKELQVKVEFNSDVTSIEENISVDLDISIDVAQDSDNPLPANDYYVTYDYTTNGGENSNAVNDYVAEGSNVNLEYTATKAGYEFMGWNTDKGAVTGLKSLSMPSNNVTLYAIFRKIDTTPPVISNVSTSATTNSITVVTTAIEEDGEIVKYEYKINDEEYVEGESTKTFTGLTAGESYRIKVRVTNSEGLTSESEEKQVTTSILNKPTFSESGEKPKIVTITYPEGEGLTYEYQKDSGTWQTATQSQKVEFTESGILVARVSDGTNTESASLTVEVKQDSAGSDLVDQAGTVTSGDGLYADSYEENVYTYRGANPNNYVTFNGEQWRIISVNTSDNTIKIMRNGVLSDRQFDTQSGRYQGSSGYCNNSGYGCNIWGSSSTTYDSNLSSITTLGREYNGTKYTLPSAEAELNTYLNGTYYNGLNATAKNMVKADAVYKAGIVNYASSSNIQQNITEVSSVKWKGRVALIDVTEYIRASTNSSCKNMYAYVNTSSCYNNSSSHNWMYLNDVWWTLSPASYGTSTNVWHVSSRGGFGHNYAYRSYGVRPVVTLKPEVKITSGDGSSTNSYQLSL